MRVSIYTDGACSGNPGPGGWGAILIYNSREKEISGYEMNTTNNRMELLAAIKALSLLNRKCDVDLYTDSVYLKDGMTKWLAGWVASGWRTSAKKEVKNIDLWQQLIEVSRKHDISWHWVKGHSVNAGNIRADLLAVQERDKAKELQNVHK